MSANPIINDLKTNNQDFEFYPTTNEILAVLHTDIKKVINTVKNDYNRFSYNERESLNTFTEHKGDKAIYKIERFLDIGSGSGKVSRYLKENDFNIYSNFAIEKSKLLADSLVIDGFNLIGRDYYEISLIDKSFDIVFTNPPYSDFKNWMIKTLKEVNTKYLYFLIPQRWENDQEIKKLMKEKGDISIVGEFDFLESEDRTARAKVHLVKIEYKKEANSFNQWIFENLGEFKKK